MLCDMSIHSEAIPITNSARVKCVDIVTNRGKAIFGLYDGSVNIVEMASHDVIAAKAVTNNMMPIRALKCIERQNWIVAGGDDCKLYVVDMDTLDNITTWDAHKDYVRAIVVHPTLPLVLSASDDQTIRCWNWEENWAKTKEFAGHAHYVMDISINPTNANQFATCSLDKTVKIWDLDQSEALHTIEQAHHGKGINCVKYASIQGRVCLITGGDDFYTKIWDANTYVQIDEHSAHSHNVDDVIQPEQFSIIVGASEDGTVSMWNANTRQLECENIESGVGRVWTIGYEPTHHALCLGGDDGVSIIHMYPSPSM